MYKFIFITSTTMFTIFNLISSSLLIICANALFDLKLLEEKHAVIFEKNPLKKNDLFFGQDQEWSSAFSKREQIVLSTKFGREFVCFLPTDKIKETAPEAPLIEDQNVKNLEKPEKIEHFENSVNSETQIADPATADRPYSDVIKLLNAIDSKPLAQTLFPRKDCYYYTNQNEWWGYEVCPRQEIVQFHLSAKTAGQEQISSLGKYSMDFDWKKAEQAENPENQEKSESQNSESQNSDLLKNFKKYSSTKTHVQYYSDGKLCDITKKPRTTELHWKCHGSGGTRLVRIEEPSTCNYVIHMHSALMCGHEKFESDVSSFKETDNKLPVLETVCYKAVSDGEFGNFQAEIAMEAQNRLEERMQRDEILAKFELDADDALGKSVDNVLSDISTEHLQTESGTGEVLNYQEMKTGLTDIFSKLVKKELEKLDDDASQSDELNSPESKIKTNLDKSIGDKFIDQDNDENNVPDQLRELKKEVVANLKQSGQLQDGEEMQEIKIKIMNVDENGRLVEEDLENGGAAPKFTSQQLKQIKQALMGAIVKETPEHGKKAQNNHLLDSEIYNDRPEDLEELVENAGYYLDHVKSVENSDENKDENIHGKYDGADDTTEFNYHEEL